MRALRLPPSLDVAFVVSYEHGVDVYTLHLRDGSSYEIGNAQETERYLSRALPARCSQYLPFDIVCRASAFVAVQVSPADDAVIQIDLPQVRNLEQVVSELLRKPR